MQEKPKETIVNKNTLYINSKKTTYQNQHITREELKSLIRTTSFLQIGKQFGVSDNAIRKWCKNYELPYKSTEIKKIHKRRMG